MTSGHLLNCVINEVTCKASAYGGRRCVGKLPREPGVRMGTCGAWVPWGGPRAHMGPKGNFPELVIRT